MRSEFRTLLDNAVGQLEHVIAVNLDIRGFSLFCRKVDSANVGLFIVEVYRDLIDECFPNVSFLKPTGDGLLAIIPYERDNLGEVANDTMNACLKALREFPSFCANNRMINFRVPQKLGIGLSRGAVCRLVSGDETLDYSGTVLNLASRLMNVARPRGIVFDADFDIELFPEEIRKVFAKEKVWLLGIAESEPIEIFYSKEYGTKILPMYRRRLDIRKWRTNKLSLRLEQIELYITGAKEYGFTLSHEPVDPDEIDIKLYPPKSVVEQRGASFFWFYGTRYEYSRGEPIVNLDFVRLAKLLKSLGLDKKDEVKIAIRYPT